MSKAVIKKDSEKAVRKAVVATAQAMSSSGLSPGRTGNVSARFGDGMLITPTALSYERMRADDIVFVAKDGTSKGLLAPSSEWRFHAAAYAARPGINAVVHTHSMHATVLASAHKPIPAFHYMVAVAGGKDIPLVPYATFGTEDLARHVAVGLADRDACLMANHGQIAVGRTLGDALELAFDVETLSQQYYKVLTIGGVELLSDAEMALMVERFKTYGKATKTS